MWSDTSSVEPLDNVFDAGMRELIEDLVELCQRDVLPSEFFPHFLQLLTRQPNAMGCVLWQDSEGVLEPTYCENVDRNVFADDDLANRHRQIVEEGFTSPNVRVLPPRSIDPMSPNPIDSFAFVTPLVRHSASGESEPVGVLVLFCRSDLDQRDRSHQMQLLMRLRTHAETWLDRQQVRDLRQQERLWGRQRSFARAVHSTIDVKLTAYNVANETRRLIGCDRVSVLLRSGNRWRVAAVSGQDVVDKRANSIVLLQSLTRSVAAAGESVWGFHNEDDLSPQIRQPYRRYVDETLVKGLAIVPLRNPSQQDDGPDAGEGLSSVGGQAKTGNVIGAVCIENIQHDHDLQDVQARMDLVQDTIEQSIANSLRYSGLFLMPVWQFLGRLKVVLWHNHKYKTLIAIALTLSAILALILTPAQLKMQAHGVLRPTVRKDVFAHVDGTIVDVLVESGEIVNEGQTLAILRNPDIEIKMKELHNRWVKAIATRRLRSRELAQADQFTRAQRNAMETELAAIEPEIEALVDEMEIYKQRIMEMEIKSPVSGRIVTWDTQNRLLKRPVSPGQVLFSVVRPDAEWELELYMPERKIGHVLRFQKQSKKDASQRVTYVLQSDPHVVHEGLVRSIETTTNVNRDEGANVRILVDIDETSENSPVAEALPGTTVVARVYCGKSSLGYSHIHEGIDWIQRNWFYWF